MYDNIFLVTRLEIQKQGVGDSLFCDVHPSGGVNPKIISKSSTLSIVDESPVKYAQWERRTYVRAHILHSESPRWNAQYGQVGQRKKIPI